MCRSPKNVLEAYRLQLLSQTLFGLSPFYLNKTSDHVVRNRFAEIYTISIGVIFMITVVATFFISLSKFSTLIMDDSYLWGVIIYFELAFTNGIVPFVLMHSLCTKKNNMNFINRIHELDLVITEQFGRDLTDMHQNQWKKSIIFMATSVTYYSLVAVMVTYGLYAQNLTETGILWYSFAYQTEQGSTGILFTAITIALSLLRMRFKLLRQIWTQTIILPNTFGSDTVAIKTCMSMWMWLFKELCSLLDLLSENWGLVMIVRLLHDFTLLVSQLYVIYWIMMDNQGSDRWMYVGMIVFWMVQNVVKIAGVAICAELVVLQVNIILSFF